MTAEQLITWLQLIPLPGEGGYYRETYRSPRVQAGRSQATAIYYLLTADTCSLLHRLRSDELWHFYLGDPIEQILLHPAGQVEVIRLGQNLQAGESLQSLVPAGVWQGAALAQGGQWALLGCTVAPGFDFADWEAGQRQLLMQQFSTATHWIERLTPAQ